MISDVVTGALGEVAGTGIGLLATRLATMYRRRSTIRRRTRKDAGAPNASPDNRFLNDLISAFGSEGKLSTATDKTLRQISESRLLVHMSLCAKYNIEPLNALALVSYIYIANGAQDATEAADFAETIFSIVRDATGDPRLFADVLPQQSPQRERVVRRQEASLHQAASAYLRANGTAAGISGLDIVRARLMESDEDAVFGDIAKGTHIEVDKVDIHGQDGNVRPIAIESIFVDPDLHFIELRHIDAYYRQARSGLQNRNGHIKRSSFQSSSERIVLLGDPGGGKSTIAKKICSEIARSAMNGASILPVFVRLRSYVAAKSLDPSMTLFGFISGIGKDYCPSVSHAVLDTYVQYWLQTGRCYIVFDGLDEVLTVANRATVSAEIQAFADRYPLSMLLVTSRYVGYDVAPLQQFSHYGVGPISAPVARELYKKIYLNVLFKPENGLSASRDAFFYDASKKAAELISNPLLFTLIVIIHERRREIPDNRADLYGYCAELLFERWDGYRNIKPELPERYRLYDLLMHLSSLLLDRVDLGGRMSKGDLLEEAKAFFITDYVDNREGRASEAARLLVEHLVGRSWILHEVGEDLFEFTHRTFLEFFYGKHIEAKFENIDDLITFALSSLEDGSKATAGHLAIQVKAKDKRPVSSRVAASLFAALSETASDAKIRFSIETLGYLLPEASRLKDLAGLLAQYCVANGDGGGLLKLISNDGPLGAIIQETTVDALCEATSVSQVRELYPAIEGILQFSGQRGELYRELIRNVMLPRFEKWQRRSPFVRFMMFEFRYSLDWDVLASAGPSFWSDAGIPRLKGDRRLALLEKILLALRKVSAFERADDYVRLARATLLDEERRQVQSRRTQFLPGGTGRKEWPAAADFQTPESRRLAARAMMMVWEIEQEGALISFDTGIDRQILAMESILRDNNELDELFVEWLGGNFSYFSRARTVDRRALLESGQREVEVEEVEFAEMEEP